MGTKDFSLGDSVEQVYTPALSPAPSQKGMSPTTHTMSRQLSHPHTKMLAYVKPYEPPANTAESLLAFVWREGMAWGESG